MEILVELVIGMIKVVVEEEEQEVLVMVDLHMTIILVEQEVLVD
jgi:hypothetical protein